MEFRPTTPADIDRVMQIMENGRDAIAALGIDQWQQGYPHRGIVADDVQWGESYVVEEDGELLGTCMVSMRGDRNYDSIDGTWLIHSASTEPRYATIHRVAVAAEAKGRGLAKYMFMQVEQLARQHDCESIRVDTHPGNVPMRSLCERCGYTYCGVAHVLEAGNVPNATPQRVCFEKLM